jgi:anthranilate phosphoribosyltransferase
MVREGSISPFSLDPEDVGLERALLDDLRGGEAEENASILRSVLEGEKSPRSDVVALNGAAALFVSGLAKDVQEGLAAARDALESGRALRVLERYAESSQRASTGSGSP